jgi:HSP20 family protein
MNLMRYEPWAYLNRLQNEMNRIMEQHSQNRTEDSSMVETSQWLPSVDIKEEPSRFVLYADVPGVDPNNIEIAMEDNVLTIRGQRSYENKEEHNNYSRIERAQGVFYRKFSLPDTADGEQITAHSQHGVLEIIIPKKEQAKPRKITVNVQSGGQENHSH